MSIVYKSTCTYRPTDENGYIGPICGKNCRTNAGFGTGWCHEHKENVYKTLHRLQNLPSPPIKNCCTHLPKKAIKILDDEPN